MCHEKVVVGVEVLNHYFITPTVAEIPEEIGTLGGFTY